MRLPIPKHISLNFSAMVFLGVLLFLTWEGDHWNNVFTIRGLLYTAFGLLISGMLIGWPLTALHRKFSLSLMRKDNGQPTDASVKTIRFTGTLVLLIQLLTVYYLSMYGYSWWIIER